VGVHGTITSTAPGAGSAAVYGQNSSTSTNGSGVYGTHAGGGVGVLGTAPSGSGVSGSSTGGYGVSAQGGLAPLYLTPASTHGHPTSGAHQRGELLVDAIGTLFLCVTAGTPGSWKKVSLE
jgi:hypothetical protein